jgi:MOSC domain-containing protein YiiM
MNLLSVNVSLPIEIESDGRRVSTGIFKRPVDGPVAVTKLNLDGDRQADLKNHGGEFKAVYAYSFDHYPYWQNLLNIVDMPMGQFGENLTIAGLDESKSCIGDHLQIGDAIFAVTQPRVPCFKLGIRFNDPEMPNRFIASGYTGYYLKVIQKGVVEAGDKVDLVRRSDDGVTVRALFESYYKYDPSAGKLVFQKALREIDLSPEWRRKIEARS